MSGSAVVKDELYYSDLAYVVKRYAGILRYGDQTIERRVAERTHSVDVIYNGVCGSVFSEFQLEVFSTFEGMLEEIGEGRSSFKIITNYPDVVNSTLAKIEDMKSNVKRK